MSAHPVEIHQFLASFVDRDAISAHVRHLQRIITEMGVRSEIYAAEWRGRLGRATTFTEFRPTAAPERIWSLYHLSTGSPIASFLAQRPERLAMNYHNITPAELVTPWEPTIGQELEAARQQLADLAPRTQVAIGASQFSREELQDVGCPSTSVLPVLFDSEEFGRQLDNRVVANLVRRKDGGGADWLFVGRIAPHKCQHEIVKAFALYRHLYDPDARLHLVGGISSHAYWTALRQCIGLLGLEDAVVITGSVSDGALGAYYQQADVFVCLSEHEGFGVPLLEALYNRLPVVAFDAAAVSETLGGAGLLLSDKSPAGVATAVHRVLGDKAIGSVLAHRAQTRLTEMSLAHGTAQWRTALEAMVAAASS